MSQDKQRVTFFEPLPAEVSVNVEPIIGTRVKGVAGTVVGAERDEVGVHVTIELDQTPAMDRLLARMAEASLGRMAFSIPGRPLRPLPPDLLGPERY
jgi:hypothetical protein